MHNQSRTNKFMSYITGVLDILICLLLFISAMYKGAFYKEDTLFINMIICMLGIACLGVKLVLNVRDSNIITKSKIASIIDSGVICLVIAYFLPVLFNTKASTESTLFELTRYVNLAIIYFIVRSSSNKKIYITAIVAIAAGLAVLGIDEITYRAFEPTLNSFSMGYLKESAGRISSTIQYANITALLMLVASILLESKIINNISKIKQTRVGFGMFVAIEMFLLIIINTAIILTGSRMIILLMTISSLIYSFYLFKIDKKRNSLTILLLVLASFILVSSIDGYMLVQNYFMVILTYILTLGIALMYVVLYRIFNDKELVITKKKIGMSNIKKIGFSVVALISILIVCTMQKPLVIKDNTKTGINIERNIYGNFYGEYDLNLDITVEDGDKYSINIYEIDKNFNKKEIGYILPKDIKDGKYNSKIYVSENIERLQIVFNVTRCKVTVNSLNIGQNKVKLSYMFLPDNLVFRLKDTLTKDSNNTLRTVYYKDAMRLFKLSPIFGHGGEGFKSRYQEVQSEPYISSEVHSVPLQMLVEVGIIGVAIYLSLVVATYMLIFKLIKLRNKNGIIYLLIFTSYIVTSLFDLVFSFGIMITLFGVIIGLVVNEYKEENRFGKDEYKLDNKSTLGMTKIAVLSISLMCLILITIYSANMYRASIISIPETTEENLSDSYNRVGILEEKVRLDQYNAEYLIALLQEYTSHISLLNSIYMTTAVEQDKEILKNEVNTYIIKQKDVADKLIEYEYYNKYTLYQVARIYFNNYISYSKLYSNNFKNSDIAYAFYIGYAVKLTKRIEDVGTVNKTALNMAYNIYNEYIPALEKHNNVINSAMIQSAVNDMKNEMNIIKEKIESNM